MAMLVITRWYHFGVFSRGFSLSFATITGVGKEGIGCCVPRDDFQQGLKSPIPKSRSNSEVQHLWNTKKREVQLLVSVSQSLSMFQLVTSVCETLWNLHLNLHGTLLCIILHVGFPNRGPLLPWHAFGTLAFGLCLRTNWSLNKASEERSSSSWLRVKSVSLGAKDQRFSGAEREVYESNGWFFQRMFRKLRLLRLFRLQSTCKHV